MFRKLKDVDSNMNEFILKMCHCLRKADVGAGGVGGVKPCVWSHNGHMRLVLYRKTKSLIVLCLLSISSLMVANPRWSARRMYLYFEMPFFFYYFVQNDRHVHMSVQYQLLVQHLLEVARLFRLLLQSSLLPYWSSVV